VAGQGITSSPFGVVSAWKLSLLPGRLTNSTNWRLRIYDDHSQRVRFRIDNHKPVVQNWNVSSNFHSLFLPLSALRSMRKGSVLVIEFSPDFKTPTTATLPIFGIDEAIKQAGCKI
jgi:hypothetical protein